jgi:multicomponent Na+:H+ antiporter subunit B
LKKIPLLIVAIFALAMIYATSGLPVPGDPSAPGSGKISSYYIEHSLEDMETPNIVTAVLADYRGFDTLGETLVIFTASLACVLVLSRRAGNDC